MDSIKLAKDLFNSEIKELEKVRDKIDENMEKAVDLSLIHISEPTRPY